MIKKRDRIICRTSESWAKAIQNNIAKEASRKLPRGQWEKELKSVMIPLKAIVTFKKNTNGQRMAPMVCCVCVIDPSGIIVCRGGCCKC